MKNWLFLILIISGCNGNNPGNTSSDFVLVSLFKNTYGKVLGDLVCEKSKTSCSFSFKKGSVIKYSVEEDLGFEYLGCKKNCEITVVDNLNISFDFTPVVPTEQMGTIETRWFNTTVNGGVSNFEALSFPFSNLILQLKAKNSTKVKVFQDSNCLVEDLNYVVTEELNSYKITYFNAPVYYKYYNEYNGNESPCLNKTLEGLSKRWKISEIQEESSGLVNEFLPICSIVYNGDIVPIWQNDYSNNNINPKLDKSKRNLIFNSEFCSSFKNNIWSSSRIEKNGVPRCYVSKSIVFGFSNNNESYVSYFPNNQPCLTESEVDSSIGMRSVSVSSINSQGRIAYSFNQNGELFLLVKNLDDDRSLHSKNIYWLKKLDLNNLIIKDVLFNGKKIQIFNENPVLKNNENYYFIGSIENSFKQGVFELSSGGLSYFADLDYLPEKKYDDKLKLFKILDKMYLVINDFKILNIIKNGPLWGIGVEKTSLFNLNLISQGTVFEGNIYFFDGVKSQYTNLLKMNSDLEVSSVTGGSFLRDYQYLSIVKNSNNLWIIQEKGLFNKEEIFKLNNGQIFKVIEYEKGLNSNNKVRSIVKNSLTTEKNYFDFLTEKLTSFDSIRYWFNQGEDSVIVEKEGSLLDITRESSLANDSILIDYATGLDSLGGISNKTPINRNPFLDDSYFEGGEYSAKIQDFSYFLANSGTRAFSLIKKGNGITQVMNLFCGSSNNLLTVSNFAKSTVLEYQGKIVINIPDCFNPELFKTYLFEEIE